MKRATILVGAGGSVDFGLPTTNILTNNIKENIKKNYTSSYDLFLKIEKTLKKYYKNSSSINYESIYHVVHELISNSMPSLGAHDEFRPILFPFFKSKMSADQIELASLADFIMQSVHSDLSEKLKNVSKNSLSKIESFINCVKSDYTSRIYTTNHDDIFLRSNNDLYTGFIECEDDILFFDRENFWKNWNKNSIFFLHGSLNFGYLDANKSIDRYDTLHQIAWYKDSKLASQRISSGNWGDNRQDGGIVKRFSIITGLEKLSQLQVTPMSYYYSALSKDLNESDLIIVIGYGFNDLHINSLLSNCRLRNNMTPILIIDLWKDGFVRTHEKKERFIFHDLKVTISNNEFKLIRHDDFLLEKATRAAIWEDGFAKFLSKTNSFQKVIDLIS